MAAAEKEAKLEAAQLQAELAQLRREREKNLKTLNQTQLHEKDWERHADMLKTAVSLTSSCRCTNFIDIVAQVEKSEMTVRSLSTPAIVM